jgi:hypothetical protein
MATLAETLVRDLVEQVRHTQKAERQACGDCSATHSRNCPLRPARNQVVTVPGIGNATAAVHRQQGHRHPALRHAGEARRLPRRLSRREHFRRRQTGPAVAPRQPYACRAKGNDLARHYLWNAARSAIRHAIRRSPPSISRLKAKGTRGDVAIGHCMRKLLHLVFAVWKSNRPFDEKHFPWQKPNADTNEMTVGHKRDLPAIEVVTTANDTVAPTLPNVETAAPKNQLGEPVAPATRSTEPATAKRSSRPKIDFAFLRQQVTMEQILRHLGLFDGLRGRGLQRRGPCPIHGNPTDKPGTFSAHLGKNVFQCFKADCAAQGNVLDFWAAVHHQPLYEAALNLAETFHLARNREEEPVKGTR